MADAAIGESWKSAKSSLSNAENAGWAMIDARLTAWGGGRAREEAGGNGAVTPANGRLEDAFLRMRGDFSIGGGAGGEICGFRSTGDWKSEKSSSSNRFEDRGTVVGETADCGCVGGRRRVELEVVGNALARGVSSPNEAGSPLPAIRACPDACGGLVGLVTRCGYSWPRGSDDVGELGEASPAVSYDVEAVEEPDNGPSSFGIDAGGRGNESLGFAALLAMTEGAIALNEGGGGKTRPASGGGDICARDGGRDDDKCPRAVVTGAFEGPAPGVLAGVIGRDGTMGGANTGNAGRATLPGDGVLPESNEPKRLSRSFIAPVGEVAFAPEPVDDRLAALKGRRGGANGGANGGGANGGASTGTAGSFFALTNFSSASAESSSTSSLALGTMSDRNSRSSVDSAREL